MYGEKKVIMEIRFGTDGIRGVANADLTPEMAMAVGRAAALVLKRGDKSPRMVIGRDTRLSGQMLEAALVAGICSAGVDVLLAGVLPTPAVAYLTRELGLQGGVVISASHNPAPDNGIKFFGPSGYKLPDEVEEEIAGLASSGNWGNLPTGGKLGRPYQLPDAVEKYASFLLSTVDVSLAGMKIVVDCAHGAAYQVAPAVLRRLGAEVVAINTSPDGCNINVGCGSTHPEQLMRAVQEHGADLGLAHDGDADRVLAVDHNGQLVDGDQIMVICARDLQQRGRLSRNTAVVTVMSNLGLHLALQKSGINVLQTKVGDRYVLEECLKSGAVFGGEQSGHILFLEHNTTGDGILTALQLLAVVKKSGRPLAELAGQMQRLPQLLVNQRVKDKQAVMSSPALLTAIRRYEKLLQGRGRILVRPSGTEPLVRVMAEGEDQGELQRIVDELVQLIRDIES